MTEQTSVQKLEILIVEDREENRNAARQAFSKMEGLSVDFASNYEDAIKQISLKPYGAAIIDLMFPRKSGETEQKLGDKLIVEAKRVCLPAVILTGGYFHGEKPLSRIFFDEEDLIYGSGRVTEDKTNPGAWLEAYSLFNQASINMAARARIRSIRTSGLIKPQENPKEKYKKAKRGDLFCPYASEALASIQQHKEISIEQKYALIGIANDSLKHAQKTGDLNAACEAVDIYTLLNQGQRTSVQRRLLQALAKQRKTAWNNCQSLNENISEINNFLSKYATKGEAK
jgi:hypothetical protein